MLERLTAITRNRTTYRLGLLQDKAYRVMKKEMSAVLAPHKLSTTEWAFLGLLHDEVVSYPSEAAEELGIEAAFVTVMTKHLKERGFMTEKKDASDNRRKCIKITATGKKFVSSVETEVRNGMRGLATGASPRVLADYVLTLERVIANAKNR